MQFITSTGNVVSLSDKDVAALTACRSNLVPDDPHPGFPCGFVVATVTLAFTQTTAVSGALSVSAVVTGLTCSCELVDSAHYDPLNPNNGVIYGDNSYKGLNPTDPSYATSAFTFATSASELVAVPYPLIYDGSGAAMPGSLPVPASNATWTANGVQFTSYYNISYDRGYVSFTVPLPGWGLSRCWPPT